MPDRCPRRRCSLRTPCSTTWGPWTEEDFLALPEHRRIELLDGELLVSPAARRRHQRLSMWLAVELASAAPVAFELLEAINVRVAPGRILIPDVVVTTDPGSDDVVAEASAVAMVVEMVSPGSVVAHRAITPPLCAAAGIPHYLRIEYGDLPGAVAYVLHGGQYVAVTRAGAGEVLRLTEPFAVEIDLAELGVRTRPPS